MMLTHVVGRRPALRGVALFSSKRRTRFDSDGERKRHDKLFSALRVKQQEQLKRLRESIVREEREAAARQQREGEAEASGGGGASTDGRRVSSDIGGLSAPNGSSASVEDNAAASPKRRLHRDLERMVARKAARQEKVKHLPLFREDSPLWRLHGSDRTLLDYDNLPDLAFAGPIDVIHSAEQERSFIAYLAEQRVFGVDTESMPHFDSQKRQNPVCLIQIATLERSFLYRIPRGGSLPPHLRTILEDPAVVKVGHSLDDDFRLLEKSKLVSGVATTIDTLPIATKLGCLRPGLKTLCKLFLGGKISKEMQVSNWEAPELSFDQIQYAATDAWAPLRVMLEMIQLEDAKQLILVKSYNARKGKIASGEHALALTILEESILENRARSSVERVI